jgi:chromosome segregation ATPase
MSRLASSPASSSASARKTEISELRHQLAAAHQSLHDLKTKLRDADRKASQATFDLQTQLSELEEERSLLEQALEDARCEADEAARQHAHIQKKLKHRLEKAEREPRASEEKLSVSERHDLHAILRKTQLEADALEHDVRYQAQTIDTLTTAESSLRKKLERARSERAAFRLSAEKLQRDVRQLKATGHLASPNHNVSSTEEEKRLVRFAKLDSNAQTQAHAQALDTVVRAAEGADEKHKKELRGMVMQMEWMQKRWEREAGLRADVAYAKRFLALQLEVANAWYVSLLFPFTLLPISWRPFLPVYTRC